MTETGHRGRLRPPSLVLLFTLGGTALASDERWLVCEDIEISEARLACYDDASRSARARAPLPEAARAPVASDFGKREEPPEPEVSEISAKVVTVARSSLGRTIVTLDNGQVWVTNEPGRHQPSVGDTVTVARSSLRYSMRLRSGLLIAVHRAGDASPTAP
jgi:hypothetical protein